MCGITGFFNHEQAAQKTLACLKALKNRGRDGQGIATETSMRKSKTLASSRLPKKSKSALGHCLHAVVGNIRQPLKAKGLLVVNGEIYNWQELRKKHGLKARNDSELLLKLIEKNKSVKKTLRELNGVFALAYWNKNTVTLARDTLGEKPEWYSLQNGLAFASEKKALEQQGCTNVCELNPRTILEYDITKNTARFFPQLFFSAPKESKKPFAALKKELQTLFCQSVAARKPKKKLGVLFSGGVDSSFLAFTCKQLGIPFTCYTAGVLENGKMPRDVIAARTAARILGTKLSTKTIPFSRVPEYLAKIIPLIEDNNVVKAGVALPFFLACEQAQKDGVKVLFSGTGADELFAGYSRFSAKHPVAEETISHLRRMYEKDFYRDDCITMHHSIELRLPYLDHALVLFALTIPAEHKLSEHRNKIILRELARDSGLPETITERKKTAAQYGSNADRAIEKLARQNGFREKSAYLKTFSKKPNLRLAALVSGGKDSLLALQAMARQNYEIACLITLKSSNPHSFMFHTPNVHVVQAQAEALGIPLIEQETKGEKEAEVNDLAAAVKKAIGQHQIEGIISGALYSNYQRTRIEKVADTLGIKVFAPLWHANPEAELRHLLAQGYKIVFSSVAAQGLGKEWVGKELTEQRIAELVKLQHTGLNAAGEGGEYETLVLDMPLFRKRIEITDFSVHEENEYSAHMVVKKYALVQKT